jgi:hypothetical protein
MLIEIEKYGGHPMRINTTMPNFMNQGNNGTIAGVPLPNFNHMPTKSTPKLSDDEIRARIVELAKEYATTGRRNDAEVDKYTGMFSSSAAPDRKGAITNALTALESKINSLRKLSNHHMSIGEWLDLLFGRAMLNENFTVNHIDVHDSNGNLIATFNESTGWRAIATEGEMARVREMAGLFHDTVVAVRNGTQTPQAAGNTGQNDKPMVDITGEVIEPPVIDVKM